MVATAPEKRPRAPRRTGSTSSRTDWDTGTGREREVKEPATGRHLLTIRESTPDDVASRLRSGRGRATCLGRGQLPGPCRGPAASGGDLREASARVRHVDPARDRRPSQQDASRANFAAGEALAAATIPWQPYGSLVPTVLSERLSMIRRVPVGVVARDHALELAERPGDARRGPGTCPGQCRRPQAGPTDAGLRRSGVRGDLQGGGTARRPAADRHRRCRDRPGADHRS